MTSESAARPAPHSPDVSVIVATRNRASLLPSCLESLATQTTTAEFEVIVVDNGSEDDTAEVVCEWLRRDSRIRLVAEPTIGLSSAKNAGIRAARGAVLAFTDDDVVLDPGWVEAYAAFFRHPQLPLTLAGGPVQPITPDLARWPAWLSDAALADLPGLSHGRDERRLGRFDYLWGANMAAPRGLFDEIGGFDESLGRSGDRRGSFEDVELNERVAEAGGECRYWPAALVWHRVGDADARPRAVAGKAFNRGANDVLRAARGSHFSPSARVPTARVAATLVLPIRLATWVWAAVAFRITSRPELFELARRSAWASGWCLVASTRGRSSRRIHVLGRLGLLGRALALRATPR